MSEDEPIEETGSAFCDKIIEKFIERIANEDGLQEVSNRLRVTLVDSNQTNESALRAALFSDVDTDD